MANPADIIGTLPPLPQKAGRMRVLLTLHGGEKALADVMNGLITRNVRSIQEGKVPNLDDVSLAYDEAPVWRDSLTALRTGKASAGTLAAWRAAEERAKGAKAVVALVSGVPQVATIVGGSARSPSVVLDDPSVQFGRPADYRPGVVGATTQPTKGRVTEYMYLSLDDDKALPVREIGDAIARHNARRIETQGLPPLYKTNVKYSTEGTPEKWWDAEEILSQGQDDCEGLAAYRAGELMLQGFDAHVDTRPIEKPEQFAGGKKGGRLFHALVRVDGYLGGPKFDAPVYDDPSVRLGMPVPDWYLNYAKKRRAQGRAL